MKINKEEFIKSNLKTIEDIIDLMNNVKKVNINILDASKTALVIVDMINGFSKDGMLKSDRIAGIIPGITELSKIADDLKIKKIAFADAHNQNSPEFDMYPKHCLDSTSESEVVDEIKDVGGYQLIKKNSTNGFLEDEFQEWLKSNQNIENFIVVGDCTDICVEQFSVTLKTWFNRNNMKSRIIVPLNLVETYDLGTHNAELINLFASFSMMGNGIEIVELEWKI